MVKGAGGIFYGLSLRPEFKPLKQQLIRGSGRRGKIGVGIYLKRDETSNQDSLVKKNYANLKDLKISRNLIFYFVMVF